MASYRLDKAVDFNGTLLQASKTYVSDDKLELRIAAVTKGMIDSGFIGGTNIKIRATIQRDGDCSLSERLFTILIHETEWIAESNGIVNGYVPGEYKAKRIIHNEKFYATLL